MVEVFHGLGVISMVMLAWRSGHYPTQAVAAVVFGGFTMTWIAYIIDVPRAPVYITIDLLSMVLLYRYAEKHKLAVVIGSLLALQVCLHISHLAQPQIKLVYLEFIGWLFALQWMLVGGFGIYKVGQRQKQEQRQGPYLRWMLKTK